MLVFNCTKAFATFIGNSKEAVVESAPTGLISEDPSFRDGTSMQWVVHLVRVKRKNCVIAMHVGSRYAIVMVGLKKGDLTGFVDTFCRRLINEMFFLCSEEGLVGQEYATLVAENFVDKHSGVRFYKRGDRSVQAHITDVACSLERDVDLMGGLPDGDDESFEFGRHVNSLLRKTKGVKDYFYPFEVMRDAWYADICAEIVDPGLLDRLEGDVPLPENVIVLANYRRRR